MKKYDFYLILRFFIYILEFFLLYSLEQIPGLSFKIYGVRPLLLVPFFVSAVVFESEMPALALGIICGLLIDISFGTTLGCFMLVLGLIGYFTGVMFKYFVKINLFSAMIFNFFILAVVSFLRFYFKFSLQNDFYVLKSIFVPILCYSGFLFPVAYYFNKYIYYKFSERQGERR